MTTKTISFKARESQAKEIDRIVKERGYTSRGEFIRDLLRKNMEPELTQEAIERIKKGRRQLAEGKGKKLEEI